MSNENLNPDQFMSLSELRTLNSGDYDVPMSRVPRAMDAEWRAHQDGTLGESVRGSWIDHGGPSGHVRHVADSISEEGIKEPLKVRNDTLIDGHHRALAAIRLGLPQVPVERSR